MAAIKIIALTVFFMLLSGWLTVNSQITSNAIKRPQQLDETKWVAQQMKLMTPDERIGQLFMVAAYTNKNDAHKMAIADLVRKHNIGGVIFMQGTAQKQVQHTNYYQAVAKVPLLVAIDGEWGLSMRLEDAPNFPRQLTLGAIQNNNLIFDMGKEIARQCKRIGVHVNFAPVVDVNNNPDNPVINDRSFGEDKYNVAQKGIAYMQGMEMNGVLACAKHFPGHGDTDTDSHHALPLIKHDINRLKDIELYPFREMVKMGVSSMMIAHLAIPALDDEPIKKGATLTMPTTLSKKVVTDLLKKEMGYNGLLFTDALNMKGVSAHFEPGIVDVKALLAGNDVLLFSENVSKAKFEIKKAIERNEITQEEIDSRVEKILKAKYKAGLHSLQQYGINNIKNELYSTEYELLYQRLIENAITLARDDRRDIPFKQLENKTFASISIGASTLTEFQNIMGKYTPISHHTLKKNDSPDKFTQKLNELKSYSHVIVGVHQMSKSSKKAFGITQPTLKLIKALEKETKVTVVLFGSPYGLTYFDSSSCTVVAYENSAVAQSAVAQVLFGGLPAKGRLPVSAGKTYKSGHGYETTGAIRFKYTIPEDAGIRSADLKRIDDIANKAIADKATPGCQVFIAKDGKVIFEKSYGYHTYNRRVKVNTADLYDLASITKISATMLGLMELYDRRQVGLSDKLSYHIPETNGTNKQDLVLKDILIHESGLKSWIPFYEATVPHSMYNSVYHSKSDAEYNLEVANNMFMRKSYLNTMWQDLYESPLPNLGEYKYSDLGYYFMKDIIERKNYKPLDEHMNEHFYAPLGLSKMTYKPTQKFSKYSLIPTENDQKWRKQVVHGYVHDMGAAMLGGVGGHAGLFSNANDLAVIMKMLVNGGHYGGRYYLNENTIKTFTAYQKTGSRRGLGFDKPEFNEKRSSAASRRASRATFGHTGFTGTCVWADPDNDLIYVFLSNRTYPKMNNYKLVRNNVRTDIHDVIYEAIARGKSSVYAQGR